MRWGKGQREVRALEIKGIVWLILAFFAGLFFLGLILFFTGYFIFFTALTCIAILVILAIVIVIGIILLIFAIPYYALTHRTQVEYGNYTMDQVKGRKDKGRGEE